MMAILRILVFILVQRCVVCDELYPISVLSDITESQLEGFSDNNKDDVELSQEKSYVVNRSHNQGERPNNRDIADIKWIKENIVDEYGFEKKRDIDEWKKQPTFEGDLTGNRFIKAAVRAGKFFVRNNNWEITKKKFRTSPGCTDLLYITAARYLFVTCILYLKSDRKLIPCEKTDNKKILIPDSGVCYPAPPTGSATCTSDYDVSLVGKDAGFLIEKFNNYFQDVFKKPSDLVFDTNVYAFTMAYAFPVNFVGLPYNFALALEKSKKTVNFKMQELASAYFKVFKYNPAFFGRMKTGALGAMRASESIIALNEWLEAFSKMNAKVKLRIEDFNNLPQQLRAAHNAEYQKRVKEMSQKGGYNAELLGNLAMAEIYAAEAYHTRGAMKHVVGRNQMKVNTPLTTEDLWVSMIENWGESNKEYKHCENDPMEECLLKMSKYMERMFNAMGLVLEHIPVSCRGGLLQFKGVSSFSNPEFAFQTWLGYKKQGKTAIPQENMDGLKECLGQFQCDLAVQQAGSYTEPLPAACMSKINDIVNDYNMRLAGMVTDNP